ncbi:MAG TPA: HlyD family efflux transporter periplasmic adaptor subunit [Pirellulaceae bacterium]|nr:HlyD family efflux transporter periplasmic adaptor subunit [Pirellulaceae bacterium]
MNGYSAERKSLGPQLLLVMLLIGAGAPLVAAQDPTSEQATGTVMIRDVVLTISEAVEIPAESVGKLGALSVVEGDVVRRGSLLAEIDSREAANRVEAAEIAVRKVETGTESTIDAEYARKALEVAETELRRAVEANERVDETYTQTEIDRLQLVVERGRLEIERELFRDRVERIDLDARRNDLAFSRLLLDRHRIVAPIDGMIASIERRAGEWVEEGKSVFRIVRVDRLRAEGFVSAVDAAHLQRGAPVTFVADLPGLETERFQGTITFVSFESNPVDDLVKIWAEIDNSRERLRPGLRGSLRLESAVPTDGAPGIIAPGGGATGEGATGNVLPFDRPIRQ